MKFRIAHSSVYLIPSIHLTYEPFSFSENEKGLIETADVLVLEAKPEMPPEHWYRHTPPYSIANDLPVELVDPFRQLWQRCELPIEDFDSTKLWWASMLIGVRSHMQRGARFDWGTEAMARKLRGEHPVEYLETANEAFSAFADAPNAEMVRNAQDLLFHLEERMSQMDEALALVKAGDLSGCEKLYAQYIAAFPAMWSAALGERNRRLVPKLVDYVDSNRSAVCIVGAMHLVGEVGLPALLGSVGLNLTSDE